MNATRNRGWHAVDGRRLRKSWRAAASSPAVGAARLVASFAVGYPDVFDLHGVVEEPAAFALFDVEPIDGAAFVRKNLFQISHGKCFSARFATSAGEAPH